VYEISREICCFVFEKFRFIIKDDNRDSVSTFLKNHSQPSLCTDVTLDEARERTFVSWMKILCSGHVDFPKIWGKASDWTVLYLNLYMTNEDISLVN
jgi:hypothetical protein